MESVDDDFVFEFNNVDEALESGRSRSRGPNHNPPGIAATGMTVICEDGVRRCPCVCHCVYCLSGIDPDRHLRLYKPQR